MTDQTKAGLDARADLDDPLAKDADGKALPRCPACGDVMVIRSGPGRSRCVECLLQRLSVVDGGAT